MTDRDPRDDADAAECAQRARRVVALAGAMDVAGLAALLADDVVMALPFAPDGWAREHVGRHAVIAFQERAAASFASFAMTADAVRTVVGEPVAVMEAHSVGTTTAGRAYANRYVMILTFAPDGRIARWTEYYDPAAVLAAFG